MIRSTLVAAAALAALLIAPATSLGGGWATVGLSSTPDGARPGESWVVDLTILQHARTPLEGVKPKVTIWPTGTGAEEAFAARPTERPGVYRARVTFPSAGEWSYSVDDGFSMVHQFGSVRIGAAGNDSTAAAKPPAAAGPSDSDGGVSLVAALGIAAAAGLIATLATALLRRRIEPEPAEG